MQFEMCTFQQPLVTSAENIHISQSSLNKKHPLAETSSNHQGSVPSI